MKLTFVTTFSFLAFFMSTSANATSAVAYGKKTVFSTSNQSSLLEATQKALENCSQNDTHCQILLTCEEKGFGATAVERLRGIITSIGASCGVDTQETAKNQALNNCKENAFANDCQIRTLWNDE